MNYSFRFSNETNKNRLGRARNSFGLARPPIKRLIAVKDLPTHRDSATLHSGVADCHYLLIIPFIRVSIINFNHGEGSSK